MKFITQLEDVEIIENGVCELRVSCQYNTWITLYSSRNPSTYVHYRCTATSTKTASRNFLVRLLTNRIWYFVLWEDHRTASEESLIFTRGFVSPSVPARFRTSRFKDVHRTTVLTRSPVFFHLTTWQLCPQLWNPGEVYRTESNEKHVRQLVATSRLLLRVCVIFIRSKVPTFLRSWQLHVTSQGEITRFFRRRRGILLSLIQIPES